MRLVVTFLWFLVLSAAAWAGPTVEVGSYRVDLTTNPPRIPVGKADLILSVVGADGQPLEGAQVRALAEMPGMKMGEREETAQPRPGAPGRYVAPAIFPMAGGYLITVTIQGPEGETATGRFEVATGQDTSEAEPSLWWTWLPWLLGLAILAFVVHRAVATGQSFQGLLTRQGILGVLLILAMLAVSVYAVRTFRRPGAMTPLEAQIMEMDMPAPPGVMPVVLVPVRRASVEATIRYSGQAAAYQDLVVNPRTTGVIEWMPFYPGDRVKAGQLLARLDTSQLGPELSRARAEARMADEEVHVAQAEGEEAQAQIHLAHAEVGALQGALDAARAGLRSAEEERSGARAEVEYWRAQLKRSQQLFEDEVLSEEEWQRDQTEAAKAEARFQAAGAGVERAQAELRRTEAELNSHRAHVSATEATARASTQRVRRAEAGLEASSAELESAEAQLGYSEIRSSVDGVVTERLISPGVLVQPGQAILKVAQIDPIRLQARVPEADLSLVVPGKPVRVTDTLGHSVSAKVTSVTPEFDPTTRQAVAEAVVDNPQSTFLPGGYVTMEIVTRRVKDALAVPAAALQERTRASEQVISTRPESFVWVADPRDDGTYTARRVVVEPGPGDGRVVAIQEGLEEGWLVVTEGYQYLKDGQTLAAVSEPGPVLDEDGFQLGEVRITESGYVPKALTLKAGVPARVTFLRTTDVGCGGEVVFPDLDIQRELPLNEPVVVEFTPERGQWEFECGMGMLKGRVVVR